MSCQRDMMCQVVRHTAHTGDTSFQTNSQSQAEKEAKEKLDIEELKKIHTESKKQQVKNMSNLMFGWFR